MACKKVIAILIQINNLLGRAARLKKHKFKVDVLVSPYILRTLSHSDLSKRQGPNFDNLCVLVNSLTVLWGNRNLEPGLLGNHFSENSRKQENLAIFKVACYFLYHGFHWKRRLSTNNVDIPSNFRKRYSVDSVYPLDLHFDVIALLDVLFFCVDSDDAFRVVFVQRIDHTEPGLLVDCIPILTLEASWQGLV